MKVAILFVVMSVLAVSNLAEAHGRDAQVLGLIVEGDSLVAINASFGMVVRDQNNRWRWSCADVQNRRVTENPVVLPARGGYVMSTFGGLINVPENACGATMYPGLDRIFIDLHEDSEGRIWALTSDGQGVNVLYRSDNRGVTFALLGPVGEGLFERVVTAPSDANVVYVSGSRIIGGTGRELVLLRSRDAGASFEALDLSTSIGGVEQHEGDRTLLIRAVNPADPAHLWASTRRKVDAQDTPERLLESFDGGAHFDVALSLEGTLSDVLILDGAVFVSGDFTEPEEGSAPIPMGLWRRELTSSTPFAHLIASAPMSCIEGAQTGIFVCSTSRAGDFDVLRVDTTGAISEQSVSSAFHVRDMLGPTECGAAQTALCRVTDEDLVIDSALNVCLDFAGADAGVRDTGSRDGGSDGGVLPDCGHNTEDSENSGCQVGQGLSTHSIFLIVSFFLLRRWRGRLV